MCALMQRAGRAARGHDICGEFILLVDEWCFGPRAEDMPVLPNVPTHSSPLGLESMSQGMQSNSIQAGSPPLLPWQNSKQILKDIERRSKLPPGLWSVINASHNNSCIRREILQHFGEDIAIYKPPFDPANCCSAC